ncbi:unnamed protein product [Schistosoma bovis]|nr:unnamed protein product [Schistosoma bovis]
MNTKFREVVKSVVIYRRKIAYEIIVYPMQHQSKRYVLVDEKEKGRILLIPDKWLLSDELFVYFDDVTENDVINCIDYDNRFSSRKCCVHSFYDDYENAKFYRTIYNMGRYYKLKCSYEDEMSAHFAEKAKLSKPEDSSLSLHNDDTKMILKTISDLSDKVDRLTAYIKCSSMRMEGTYGDSIDVSSFSFPLKTVEEMRTLEAALEGSKFREQFVARLSEVICSDLEISARACLDYVLTPKLFFTLDRIPCQSNINKYMFYRSILSVLCSQFRSEYCPERTVVKTMDDEIQALLHRESDYTNKYDWLFK